MAEPLPVDAGTKIGDCPSCKIKGVTLKDVNGLFVCEKCASKKFSKRVRQRIQEAIERQEESRKIRAYNFRVELAKKALKALNDGRLGHALHYCREYLTVLENQYKVEHHALHPGLFDPKKGAGEILLIAGMYWNMARIYDHLKGHSVQTRQCLNKFIEFSVGRRHVIVASEAVRKYVKTGHPVNTHDFRKAHEYLCAHLSKCFIATAVYGPMAKETILLREFRDRVLFNSYLGRSFVKIYYLIGPLIAWACKIFPPLALMMRIIIYLIMVPMRSGRKL